MRITNEYVYENHQKTFPLVEIKYYHHNEQITIPQYFPSGVVDVTEEFRYIDDRVVNNVVFHRYLVSNFGRIFDRCTNQFLNPVSNGNKNADGTPNGYYKVKLSYYKDWNVLDYKDVYIHRAVLLMFNYYPNAEFPLISNVQTDHIDGDHSNNHISNLAWVTPVENVNRATYNGLRDGILVDRNLSTSDPRQPIRVICSLLEQGYSNREIADMTNTNIFVIACIRRGETYKEYSRDYKIPQYSIPKANIETVHKICQMLQDGCTRSQISEALGVKEHVIADIKSRRNYKYISCNYTW